MYLFRQFLIDKVNFVKNFGCIKFFKSLFIIVQKNGCISIVKKFSPIRKQMLQNRQLINYRNLSQRPPNAKNYVFCSFSQFANC